MTDRLPKKKEQVRYSFFWWLISLIITNKCHLILLHPFIWITGQIPDVGGNLEDRNQVNINIVNIYLGVKAFSWIEKGNYDHHFTCSKPVSDAWIYGGRVLTTLEPVIMIRTQGFDYLQIQNFPSANLLSWSVVSWLYMVGCHLKCFDISAIHYLSLRYHNSKKRYIYNAFCLPVSSLVVPLSSWFRRSGQYDGWWINIASRSLSSRSSLSMILEIINDSSLISPDLFLIRFLIIN